MQYEYLIAPALILLALLYQFSKRQQGWTVLWSDGVPVHPKLNGSGWRITIPRNGQGHLNYVLLFKTLSPCALLAKIGLWRKDPPLPVLKGAKRIIAEFTIEGDSAQPVEKYEPPRPATMTLMIQRKGDNYTAEGKFQSYRWYSKAMAEIKPGSKIVLDVPLDVDSWGDVYSGHDDVMFQAALKDLAGVGVVFGSAGGRGHGVYSDGPVTVTLSRFQVIR